MSTPGTKNVRLLLLGDDREKAEQLRELLRGENMDLSFASSEFEQALQQVRSWSPDVILVSYSEGPLTDLVERIDAVSGGNPIVVFLTSEQAGSSRDVLLAGARAYLPIDGEKDELVDTIVSVLDRERRRREALARQLGVEVDLGQIFAVHGAKGGVGATAVACNLAVATKLSTRKRVALVDANLYSGDVAATLNLMSRSSLADLTPHLKELDQEFLERASVRHESGLRAFLAPDDFVRAQIITGEHITRILKVMRQHYDYIIVDTCSLPDQVTSAALEESNRILLVTTPEVPSLKNAARSLRLAGEFGYRDKIVLVLNRAKSKGAVGTADIVEHLRLPISAMIGSDGRALPAAINAGTPVIERRRSRFASGIWDLTEMITGVSARQLRRTIGKGASSGTSGKAPPVPAMPVRKLNLTGEQTALAGADGTVAAPTAQGKSLLSRFRARR